MTLAQVRRLFNEPGAVKAQAGSATTYEFVRPGGVVPTGDAARPRLVQNPDAVYTVDFVDEKVVAWSVRTRH